MWAAPVVTTPARSTATTGRSIWASRSEPQSGDAARPGRGKKMRRQGGRRFGECRRWLSGRGWGCPQERQLGASAGQRRQGAGGDFFHRAGAADLAVLGRGGGLAPGPVAVVVDPRARLLAVDVHALAHGLFLVV